MMTNEKHKQAPYKKGKQTPVKKGKKSNAVSHDLMLQTNLDQPRPVRQKMVASMRTFPITDADSNGASASSALSTASFCCSSAVPNPPYGSSVGRVDKIRASMTGSGASAGSVNSAASTASTMQVSLLA
jgi:hypothetical protein